MLTSRVDFAGRERFVERRRKTDGQFQFSREISIGCLFNYTRVEKVHKTCENITKLLTSTCKYACL